MIENRLKKGLGRGLSSFLGDSSKKIDTNKVLIKDITRNKLQPRKHFDKESLEELTNSIRKQGVIQPIIVRKDKNLVGKFAIIPTVGKKIKIIEDDYADPKLGTGAVKITPAHDFNDYEVGKRHKLEIINIFTEENMLQIETPGYGVFTPYPVHRTPRGTGYGVATPLCYNNIPSNPCAGYPGRVSSYPNLRPRAGRVFVGRAELR